MRLCSAVPYGDFRRLNEGRLRRRMAAGDAVGCRELKVVCVWHASSHEVVVEEVSTRAALWASKAGLAGPIRHKNGETALSLERGHSVVSLCIERRWVRPATFSAIPRWERACWDRFDCAVASLDSCGLGAGTTTAPAAHATDSPRADSLPSGKPSLACSQEALLPVCGSVRRPL